MWRRRHSQQWEFNAHGGIPQTKQLSPGALGSVRPCHCPFEEVGSMQKCFKCCAGRLEAQLSLLRQLGQEEPWCCAYRILLVLPSPVPVPCEWILHCSRSWHRLLPLPALYCISLHSKAPLKSSTIAHSLSLNCPFPFREETTHAEGRAGKAGY